MRKTMSLLPVFLLLLAAACSRSATVESEPAPALDPAGMYDFVASVGGESRNGTLELERTATGWEGEGWLDGEADPALVDSATINGSHVTVYAMVDGEDEIIFDMDFAGRNSFTGIIMAGAQSVNVTGTRRAP